MRFGLLKAALVVTIIVAVVVVVVMVMPVSLASCIILRTRPVLADPN